MVFTISFSARAYPSQIEFPNIDDFDEEEWDVVFDVFVRIVRNFKEVYPEVNVLDISHNNRIVCIKFTKEELSEDELEYFIDIFTGHAANNIVYFDKDEYFIRGDLVLDPKKTMLERFNEMTMDIAPELRQ